MKKKERKETEQRWISDNTTEQKFFCASSQIKWRINVNKGEGGLMDYMIIRGNEQKANHGNKRFFLQKEIQER